MRLPIIILLQCVFMQLLDAQVDIFPDSLEQRIERDNLIEQTVPSEHSTILDEMPGQDSAGGTSLTMRSRIESMLQTARGYTDGHYLGSPIHSYQRLSWTDPKKYQAGILFEKDPGEKALNDFMSFHLSVKKVGIFSQLLLGDYLIESGQGLALWRGNDYTKGADIIAPLLREGRSLVPYLSSNEQDFLRGAALTCDVGKVPFLLCYSRKTISAVLDAHGGVQSFYESGQFQTTTALAHKDNTTEQLLGTRLSIHPADGSQLGILWFVSAFDRDLHLNTPAITGRQFSVLSTDYTVQLSALRSFGEVMFSNRAAAGIGSLLFSTGRTFRSICSFRYYPPGLFSIHGLGFGEGSGSSNERGLYVGCEHEPRKGIEYRIFYDQFSTLAPTTSSLFPAGGHELLMSFKSIPFPETRIELQFRQKVTQIHSQASAGDMPILYDDLLRSQWRIELHLVVNENIHLAGRGEYLELHHRLSDMPERGTLLFAEVNVSSPPLVTANLRVTYFSTDSYNSRFYSYEKNLEGAVSIPAVYGKGIRWCSLVQWKPLGGMMIALKYSDCIRDDLLHMGSGSDELPSNYDNRFGVQIDIRI